MTGEINLVFCDLPVLQVLHKMRRWFLLNVEKIYFYRLKRVPGFSLSGFQSRRFIRLLILPFQAVSFNFDSSIRFKYIN